MPPQLTIPIDPAVDQQLSDLTKIRLQVAAQARLAEQRHRDIKAANLTAGIRDVMAVVYSPAYRQAQELVASPIDRQALTSATIATSQQALIRSVLPTTQEWRTLLNDIVQSTQPALQALARSYASIRFPVPEISEAMRLMVRDQQRLSEVLRDTLKHMPPTLLGPLAQGILPLQGAAATLAEMMEDTATPRIALTQAQLAIKAHQEFGIRSLKSTALASQVACPRAADLLSFGAVGPALGVSMDALAGLARHTSPPGSTTIWLAFRSSERQRSGSRPNRRSSAWSSGCCSG
jgi:hypothetical protein